MINNKISTSWGKLTSFDGENAVASPGAAAPGDGTIDLWIVMLDARVCLVATAARLESIEISKAKTLPEGSWFVARTSGRPSLLRSVTWQSKPAPSAAWSTEVVGVSVRGSKW